MVFKTCTYISRIAYEGFTLVYNEVECMAVVIIIMRARQCYLGRWEIHSYEVDGNHNYDVVGNQDYNFGGCHNHSIGENHKCYPFGSSADTIRQRLGASDLPGFVKTTEVNIDLLWVCFV